MCRFEGSNATRQGEGPTRSAPRPNSSVSSPPSFIYTHNARSPLISTAGGLHPCSPGFAASACSPTGTVAPLLIRPPPPSAFLRPLSRSSMQWSLSLVTCIPLPPPSSPRSSMQWSLSLVTCIPPPRLRRTRGRASVALDRARRAQLAVGDRHGVTLGLDGGRRRGRRRVVERGV